MMAEAGTEQAGGRSSAELTCRSAAAPAQAQQGCPGTQDPAHIEEFMWELRALQETQHELWVPLQAGVGVLLSIVCSPGNTLLGPKPELPAGATAGKLEMTNSCWVSTACTSSKSCWVSTACTFSNSFWISNICQIIRLIHLVCSSFPANKVLNFQTTSWTFLGLKL